MRKIILCICMLLATSGVLRADPITFEATVNSPRVALNDDLQLTLTISGVKDNLDPINLPVIDGFSAKYVATSTSMSIINGNSQNERSFIYNLFPSKIGRFQIPSISATIAGQAYTTKPIDVEVFEGSSQAQAAAVPPDLSQAPSAASLKDKILIMVSVDNTQAYLNERIPLTIKLLVNGVPMRDIQYPQFEKQGFTVDDFEKPQQSSEIINGLKYDTVAFKTYIYPNRLGDMPIGPVQIQGNVIYKNTQTSPFNQDNNPLGADIFNNFFDSYSTSPMTVTSQPIQLHVLPLPEDNRPEDFTNAIGQFDFQADVSPLQVKAGDPLTLKMDIKGSGNFKTLHMPVLQAPGFKIYDPQIKDGADQKAAEEVIIPISAGIRQVPALRFSYFDPSVKEYKTIVQGPFAIQVTAPGPDQEFKAVGFSDVAREPSGFSGNQFSFGKIWNNFSKGLRMLFKSVWFWAMLTVCVGGGITYYLWRRFQNRLQTDLAFARRLKAAREARQALLQGQEYIAQNKSKDFYALLSKVLRDYLGNKWHQSSAALTVKEIVGQLRSAQLDETRIAQIKTILEQSDLVCFAGLDRDAAQMRSDLSQTEDLINHFEKHLK